MRPRFMHWHLIAFLDAPPIRAICINVRQREFFCPTGVYDARPCKEEFDDEQIVAVGAKLAAPPIIDVRYPESFKPESKEEARRRDKSLRIQPARS